MGTVAFPAGGVLTVLHWNLFVASWSTLVHALNVGDPSTARFFAGAPSVAAVAFGRCRALAENIEFGCDHGEGSEILRDEDLVSEFEPESDRMAAFIRDAAIGPMTAGSPLRNFAVALLSSLRNLMRDADVPRLEAGNYYREPNNQSYWGDHPGFTMFRVLNRLSGAQTLVHTCVVPLPDAMANLRSTYTDESVFPHVLIALKAFDTRALDLHGVLEQMHNHYFDPYGTFMFSVNSANLDGVVALSTGSMQSREASASGEVAPPSSASLERPTESAAPLSARKFWCYSDGLSTLMPFLVRMPPLHLGVRAPCEPWRFVRAAFVFVVPGVPHLPRGDARAVLPALGAHYHVRHLAEDVVY